MNPTTWPPIVWTFILIAAVGALFAVIPLFAKSFGNTLAGEATQATPPQPKPETDDDEEDRIFMRILNARNARDLMAVVEEYYVFDGVAAQELVAKALQFKELTRKDWRVIHASIPEGNDAERIARERAREELEEDRP